MITTINEFNEYKSNVVSAYSDLSIKNFELFLITERLHINKKIDEYTDKIYPIISNSDSNNFIFTDLPIALNIIKLCINIKELSPGLSVQLDINKSIKTKNGWIIHIDLKNGFMLHSLKHELNHALRLTIVGKDKMIKNLNYIKSQNIFTFSKNKEMEYFFYLMYLSNDEEINAKVMETYGYIKEIMSKWEVNKISKMDFDYIIKGTEAYKQSNQLINFKCDDVFKETNNNDLNKMFYILEENKAELNKIQDSIFSTLKLVIKTFKDVFNNKTGFSIADKNIYTPKHGKKFYNIYIPSQGDKLKRRIYSLYDHFS